MARILGYIATSLDGLIATEDDNLGWLFKYDAMNSASTATARSSSVCEPW